MLLSKKNGHRSGLVCLLPTAWMSTAEMPSLQCQLGGLPLRSPAEHCCPVVKDRAGVMSENNPLPKVAISLATVVSSSIGCS